MLSGCAETFLRTQIENVEDDYPDLNPPSLTSVSMSETMSYAWDMADAYAEAGRDTATAQDIAAAFLIAAAASTVIGEINDVADSVLAERAAIAATAQQFGQRGVPQASIRAMYDGARRINCVATVGAMLGDRVGNQQAAAFVMLLMIREIEFRTYEGLARELPAFSAIRNAINAELPQDDDARAGLRSQGGRAVVEIEDFYRVAAGCLSEEQAPQLENDNG